MLADVPRDMTYGDRPCAAAVTRTEQLRMRISFLWSRHVRTYLFDPSGQHVCQGGSDTAKGNSVSLIQGPAGADATSRQVPTVS